MPEKILALKIRNHPAVIARIAGLFVRRAYSLSSLDCRPGNDNGSAMMYITVPDNVQLPQVVKNLQKLYDVHEVAVTAAGAYTL